MNDTQKIAEVITKCNDCKWLTILKDVNEHSKYASVCEYIHDDAKAMRHPFMLDFHYVHPMMKDIPIPDNCPLEDYNVPNEN